LLKALKQYGTLSRETVLAPAIKLAREGFPLPDVLAKSLHAEADHLQRWPATRKIFFKPRSHCQSQPCADDTSHVPLEAGDIVVQLDLANTLERIARDGVRGFYEGETAEKIAAEMKAHQGIVSLKDLSAYRVVERQPVVGTYRGYRVVSMPPPSSGGAHVVQILNILERYPLGHYGAGSAQAIHLMTEGMKLAFADRSQYMGDPDFVKIALRGLTSRAYADQLAASIHGSRAIAGNDLGPGKPQAYESSQTTHYSVLDQAGNAVSTTYTLNLNFGSGIVAEGKGVLLNNEMDDFAIKAGEANAVQASKRPLSSMTPVIVLKDDKPWLVTGSPGGARIISTVLQTLVNAIDHGMNPAESAAQPRFHHQGVPDELRIERGFSPDTLNRLKSMGHNIAVKPPMGRTQTIQWHDGMLYGASDPRNPDGLTAGY
jgi:gamma-glutamyltranspeptidase/glutathione hydrolase